MATYNGTDNRDIYMGTDEYNVIYGNGGNDILYGGNHSDKIYGGTGNDWIFGNAGTDTLWGDAGDDGLFGGAGQDTIYGGEGNDILDGGPDDGLDPAPWRPPFVVRGPFNPIIRFEDDHNMHSFTSNVSSQTNATAQIYRPPVHYDWLYGGNGDDVIRGRNARDFLNGDAGNDTILSYGRNSKLTGGDGNDTLTSFGGGSGLYGGNGNDELHASAIGRDSLNGGQGNDRMWAGAGADSFKFRGDFGQDTIIGFGESDPESNQDSSQNTFFLFSKFDIIDLASIVTITDYDDLMANHMFQSGNNTIIDAEGGNTITLENVSMASLTEDNFNFETFFTIQDVGQGAGLFF